MPVTDEVGIGHGEIERRMRGLTRLRPWPQIGPGNQIQAVRRKALTVRHACTISAIPCKRPRRLVPARRSDGSPLLVRAIRWRTGATDPARSRDRPNRTEPGPSPDRARTEPGPGQEAGRARRTGQQAGPAGRGPPCLAAGSSGPLVSGAFCRSRVSGCHLPSVRAHLPLVWVVFPPVRAHLPVIALTTHALRCRYVGLRVFCDRATNRKSAQLAGKCATELSGKWRVPEAGNTGYSSAGEGPASKRASGRPLVTTTDLCCYRPWRGRSGGRDRFRDSFDERR